MKRKKRKTMNLGIKRKTREKGDQALGHLLRVFVFTEALLTLVRMQLHWGNLLYL